MTKKDCSSGGGVDRTVAVLSDVFSFLKDSISVPTWVYNFGSSGLDLNGFGCGLGGRRLVPSTTRRGGGDVRGVDVDLDLPWHPRLLRSTVDLLQ